MFSPVVRLICIKAESFLHVAFAGEFLRLVAPLEKASRFEGSSTEVTMEVSSSSVASQNLDHRRINKVFVYRYQKYILQNCARRCSNVGSILIRILHVATHNVHTFYFLSYAIDLNPKQGVAVKPGLMEIAR